MSKKVFIFAVILVLAVLGGWWLLFRGQRGVQNAPKQPLVDSEQPVQPPQTGESLAKMPEIQTTIDPDVNHWQTKETEFFTIKFPKEWYWLESNPRETGYHSMVITNNANFPIGKFPDIAVFIGSNDSPFTVKDRSELALSFTNLWPTTQSYDSKNLTRNPVQQSLDSKARQIKDYVGFSVTCFYLSEHKAVSAVMYCSFVDKNHQKVQTYYIANNKVTIAFTARTTEDTTVRKDILDEIAKSVVLK